MEGDGIVGSMSARWREWRRKGAPRLLVQWLRNGVPLRWKGPAPQRREEDKKEQTAEMKKELQALVTSGAFTRGEAVVVAPTFLIPKKDGSMRLIHDLRETNSHIAPPHFTLHGARDAGEVTRNSSWLAVLDLKHGYQQVAMDPQARRYLGARMGDEVLVSTVLPFGLNLSPYVFTRLTNWLARQIRERFKLEVAVYIDDFLLGARTKEGLEEGLRGVKSLFEELGVVVSTEKEVAPATKVEFIGFTWDASRKVVGVPAERRREYRRAVKNLLRHPQTRNTWRRVIGKLGFLREAIGPTMRHIRSLLHLVAARRRPGALIEASGEAREDLEWWAQKLGQKTELSLDVVPVSASVTTDASDGGLGYLIRTEALKQDKTGPLHFERGLRVEDESAHINRKELEAVLKALQEHREELRGRHLVWYSDSRTALAAVRRQGTQKLSPAAWKTTKEVLDLAEEERISILAKHVPGRLNCAADALSRPDEERGTWERALEAVTKEWGPLQEDPCGATRDPTSLLEGLEWARGRTLLLPKVQEIGEVVQLLSMCAGSAQEGHPSLWGQMAVVITPLWRGTTWWRMLEEMRVGFIHLGRLEVVETRGWRQRNGHWPDWTASLIPLKIQCGRPGRGTNTGEHSSDSSDGRKCGGSAQKEEDNARREA